MITPTLRIRLRLCVDFEMNVKIKYSAGHAQRARVLQVRAKKVEAVLAGVELDQTAKAHLADVKS